MSEVFSNHNYEMLRQKRVILDEGFVHSVPIPLNCFTRTDGAALGAISSDALGLKSVGSPAMLVMRFAAAATTTDLAKLSFVIPSDYRQNRTTNTGQRSNPVLRVCAKKVDVSGSATDNTDLALTMQAMWNNPAYLTSGTFAETAGDTTSGTFATVVSNTLNALAAAEGADGNPETKRWYNFNFANNTTGGLTTAQLNALVPGAPITIQLAPQETVGTNQAIDVYAVEFWYPGHARVARELDKSIVYF